MAHRKRKAKVSETVNLTIRTSTGLLNDFRQTVEADESNVSVELRRFMREHIAERAAEREGAVGA